MDDTYSKLGRTAEDERQLKLPEAEFRQEQLQARNPRVTSSIDESVPKGSLTNRFIDPITGERYLTEHERANPDYDVRILEGLAREHMNAEHQATNNTNPLTGEEYQTRFHSDDFPSVPVQRVPDLSKSTVMSYNGAFIPSIHKTIPSSQPGIPACELYLTLQRTDAESAPIETERRNKFSGYQASIFTLQNAIATYDEQGLVMNASGFEDVERIIKGQRNRELKSIEDRRKNFDLENPLGIPESDRYLTVVDSILKTQKENIFPRSEITTNLEDIFDNSRNINEKIFNLACDPDFNRHHQKKKKEL